MKLKKNYFNPCPSLPSVATVHKKQFLWLNIVLNNKPYHYFLKSIDAKTLLSFLKIERRKSLRQVAMVAKFLDAKKIKTSLKKWIRTVSNSIDLL